MHFNNHICWYLDNTFCGSLHDTQAAGFDVKVVSGVLCIGLWLCGIFMLFKDLFDAGARVKRQVQRRNMRLRAALEVPLARTCYSTARASFEQAGPLAGDSAPCFRELVAQQARASSPHHLPCGLL